MIAKKWVKLPTGWIEQHGLSQFRWATGGSSNIAALMLLMIVAHHADDIGTSLVTYDSLALASGLSRTKIADGLKLLCELKILERSSEKQSQFKLCNYDPKANWGKLPAKPLYRDGAIYAFKDFHLRHVTELDALKAYLSFVARRDNSRNLAHMTYEQIEKYADIRQVRIKSALSLLAVTGLVHVEHVASSASAYGIANAYRLAHLDTSNHLGTRGRGMLQGNESSAT